MVRSAIYMLAIMIGFYFGPICHASVTETYNKSLWQQTVQNWTTIDFTGWPQFTPISTQYAAQGVIFPDNNDHIAGPAPGSFPNDHWGLASNEGFGLGQITCQFDRDMYWVAVDHPQNIRITLFLHDVLIYTSNVFQAGISRFAGLLSTEPFDKAVVQRTVDTVVVIDDLFFGAPVPAPGALGLIALAGLVARPHRRT